MAAFPSSLPEPLLDAFQFDPGPVSIRTDMEAGAARVRKRFTAGITEISVSWMFVGTEFATFKTFYETDINEGASWFDILLDLGSGNATHECRFIDRYTARPRGLGVWQVSARLESRT